MRLIRTLFVAALAMGASLAHADDSAAVQRLTGLLNNLAGELDPREMAGLAKSEGV